MKLAQYLTDSGLKQEDFAKLVGISQPHVSRLLKGGTWPQRALLQRITEATGGKVTADDFLVPEPSNGQQGAAA